MDFPPSRQIEPFSFKRTTGQQFKHLRNDNHFECPENSPYPGHNWIERGKKSGEIVCDRTSTFNVIIHLHQRNPFHTLFQDWQRRQCQLKRLIEIYLIDLNSTCGRIERLLPGSDWRGMYPPFHRRRWETRLNARDEAATTARHPLAPTNRRGLPFVPHAHSSASLASSRFCQTAPFTFDLSDWLCYCYQLSIFNFTYSTWAMRRKNSCSHPTRINIPRA